MERFLLAAVLIVVAVALAWWLRRRRTDPPFRTGYAAPAQLDRADFERPDAPWLVVVFSSATCPSCAEAMAKAEVVASGDVAVQEVRYQDRRDLHGRYKIEAAPTTVVADAAGVVQAAFVGSFTATDFWAAVAEARGGSIPPDCPNP